MFSNDVKRLSFRIEMSHFEVFPPKCEVTLLKGKMFSMNKKGRNYRKGVPLSSNLQNQVKELAQNYSLTEVGRRYESEGAFLWGDPDPDQRSKICLDNGASKEPVNPLWSWIRRFL